MQCEKDSIPPLSITQNLSYQTKFTCCTGRSVCRRTGELHSREYDKQLISFASLVQYSDTWLTSVKQMFSQRTPHRFWRSETRGEWKYLLFNHQILLGKKNGQALVHEVTWTTLTKNNSRIHAKVSLLPSFVSYTSLYR